MRDVAKTCVRGLAFALVLPALLSYKIRARLFGADRAFEMSTQWLSALPGLPGQYLRRAFLAHTLAYCAPSVVVSFGVLLSKVGAKLDDGAYIGPRCHLGLVHIQRDVLLGPGVQIPSGRHAHGTADPGVSIREQPGTLALVTIGEGSWVGAGAIVMADVGRHCVIGAGAVVTSPIPDGCVAAGVPAKVIRQRDGQA